MESPASWRQWGKPVPDCPGVWHFPVRDREHLLDLVEVLTLHTPNYELNKIVTFLAPSGGSGDEPSIPLGALADCLPLPALHARLHHPWIMEDLTTHVETHLQPIVDLVRRGQVFAYEALCRVATPAGRLLSGHEVFTPSPFSRRVPCCEAPSICVCSRGRALR